MTLSAFTPTNARARPAVARRLAPNLGRVFRRAAAAAGTAIVILVAYRAALKRLEAGERNLFDQPVLWAEIKSRAWAEAAVAAEHWKDRLPCIGALALGLGFVAAIAVAALWKL